MFEWIKKLFKRERYLKIEGDPYVNIPAGVELRCAGDPGSNGQVLASGGPGTNPTWVDPVAGLEKLGASTLGTVTGYLTLGLNEIVAILLISGGSGVVWIMRGSRSNYVYPKISIDGVVQGAPLDGTGYPISSRYFIGSYSTTYCFWGPVRFTNHFSWIETNTSTTSYGDLVYFYSFSTFGSKVIKREVEEDEASNVRYELVEYDSGIKVKRVIGNIKPVKVPPPKDPVIEKLEKLEAKLNAIASKLGIKGVIA